MEDNLSIAVVQLGTQPWIFSHANGYDSTRVRQRKCKCLSGNSVNNPKD